MKELMTKVKKVSLLFVAILFIIFGILVFGGYGELIDNDLDGNDYISDRISTGVYGTIFCNRDLGFFSYNGLQTTFVRPGTEIDKENISFRIKSFEPKIMYTENTKFSENELFAVYTSKVNLGGIFYSALDNILTKVHLTQKTKSNLFHGLSLFLFIGVIGLIAKWAKDELGKFSALLILLTVPLSYWLIPFGQGLSNSAFVYFLPFAVSLTMLRYEHKMGKKTKNWAEFFILALPITLKAMMGYECLPTIMLSSLIPYIYYGTVYQWKLSYLILRLIRASVFILLGLIFTLAVHTMQLSMYYGTLETGFERLLYTFDKRTYGVNYEFSPIHVNAQQTSIKVVFQDYIIALRQFFIVGIKVEVLAAIGSGLVALRALTFFLHKGKDKKADAEFRKDIALVVSISLSIIAAAATLIVFKAHSRIHIPYSMVIFYIPFSLFVFAYIGYAIQREMILICGYIKKKTRK